MSAINFCPSCGHRLSAGANVFCTQCGHKLQEPSKTESDKTPATASEEPVVQAAAPVKQEKKVLTHSEESSEPKKKKIKSGWIWAGVVLLVLGAIIGWGLYQDSIYPKSESQLESLLFDKYWRIQEGRIKEIYVDGRKIVKSGTNVVRSIQDAVEGNSDGAMYGILEDRMKEMFAKDNFLHIRKLKSGDLFEFDMNFDKAANDYTYTTYKPKIQYNQDHFRYSLMYPDGFMLSQRISNGEFVESEDSELTEYTTYKNLIQKITADGMTIEADITIRMGGKTLRIVAEYEYELFNASASYIKRVDSEFKALNEPESIEIDW